MVGAGSTGRRVADRMKRAVALHRAGRMAEAEAIYRVILKRLPSQPDALHFLGLIRQQQGRSDEAIHLMRRATEFAPDYADAFNNLGNALKTTGRIGEAEICYRKAIGLDARHANALSNLAVVLRAKGDLTAAEAACRSAIEAMPRHVEAHNNLGNVLRGMGRHDEAIGCYRASIALDPHHADGPRMLGLALYAAGRIDEAKEAYQQWLERDPGNPVAAHLLAGCSGSNAPARAPDGYVRDVFEGMAAEFDEHLAHLKYQAPALVGAALARVLPDPNGALEVLDAGCGTGLFGSALRAYAQELTGVDLSPAMLRRAAQRGLYDHLVEEELTAHLKAQHARYDLIVSADTLCYFGVLQDVLAAAAGALRARGWIVFSVEEAQGEARLAGYRLDPHGRYSHTNDYVRGVLESTGFQASTIEAVLLRTEGGDPVNGLLVAARVA